MPRDNNNVVGLEYSSLCENFTRDGLTVRVQICRVVSRGDCWSLEVVDHNGTSTVWSETFATDRHAYAAFIETLETEGIRSFSDENSGWLH